MTTRPTIRSRSKNPSRIPTLNTVVPSVSPADMPLPEPNLDVQTQFTGDRTFYVSREARIERLAYLIAESRGFEPGHELDDWLAAERRVDAGESLDEEQPLP